MTAAADVYLSRIAYRLGRPRPLVELASVAPEVRELCDDGLESFRVSDAEVWELGSAAAEQALDDGALTPDAVLYVSQTDSDSVSSLGRLLVHLGLSDVRFLAVAGHDCANLVPVLVTAREMLLGDHRCVLLVLSDRARGARARVMANGLSVFSDGAAACLVTTAPPNGDGAAFRLRGTGVCVRARTGGAAGIEDALLATVALAREGTARALADAGLRAGEVERLMLANYRLTSQRFLATAMGLGEEKLLLGDVAGYAHCFSADLLMTLRQGRDDGRLRPGSQVVASATGPMSWSSMALEVL